MHYKDAINHIRMIGYKRILVTGPQRSGTTITAKILAKELGFQYIDEFAIGIDCFDRLFAIYRNRNFVLQAPGISAYAHMMPGCVCFMRRSVKDIIKSQHRISWDNINEERELKKYFQSSGEIAQIKYDFWDNWQKHTKSNMLEIEYDSIQEHPLYIAPELRQGFGPKQTE